MIDPKTFVTAGDAIFTLKSRRTETRYTYRVTKKEASEQYPAAYFVKVLTGPDNESSYTYLGKLDADSGDVVLTRASKLVEDSAPVKAIRWALRRIWQAIELTDCEFHHAGKYCRCGRTLTVPESVESGIGPECAKLIGI